ncbi:MAG: Fic family protein [Bacteroidales bacterium]|nr:Fic family protein [Bacteroidales bacterium]
MNDTQKISIRFYNDHEVRAVWDEVVGQWYFSVLDIIGAINQQDDYTKTRNYWKYLKTKLKKENSELVSATNQLKLLARDGKKYTTDVLDAAGVTALAKAIPNQKAVEFLDWFTYSDNTIDGKSKKKAYELWESHLVADKDVGSVKSLQQIHAYLFGGLYDFAGKIRTKTIAKGNTLFCLAEYLHDNLATIEKMPENTFEAIVDKYVEMNVAHPFMEGNGRSTRIWLDMIFKKRLSKCVDWSKIDKTEYLDAMIESHINSAHIKQLLNGALTDDINSREMFMKGIDYSYYYEQED